MAGGRIRDGNIIGATDEFSFCAIEDRIHINDVHATILLGINHEKLSFLFQGRNQRLTDVGRKNSFTERLIA